MRPLRLLLLFSKSLSSSTFRVNYGVRFVVCNQLGCLLSKEFILELLEED